MARLLHGAAFFVCGEGVGAVAKFSRPSRSREDHPYSNFFATTSFTTAGFACPLVAFIT